jgi:hypothetical protein
MAVEKPRGCGYRKVGGKYLVGGKLSAACGLLPLELHVCPVCSSGIKQVRGWQWVNPSKLFEKAVCLDQKFADVMSLSFATRGCATCPGAIVLREQTRAGLLWIGGQFYPEPEDFLREGAAQGVSRRIHTIPRGFKVGETWVLIAHPRAVKRVPATPEEVAELEQLNGGLIADNIAPVNHIVRKGIIAIFRPERIEQIVTQSEADSDEFMRDLESKGITPVVVPDNDIDHQGRVWDKPKSDESKDADLFDEGGAE